VPPRFAYWTILIDNKPTAFRARDREELLPTLGQLRRRNADVVMRYFARGRLWDSPEQAEWAARHVAASTERRPKGWRPGGDHRDPRARFDKRRARSRPGPPLKASGPDTKSPGERRRRDRPSGGSPPRGRQGPAGPASGSGARPRPDRLDQGAVGGRGRAGRPPTGFVGGAKNPDQTKPRRRGDTDGVTSEPDASKPKE
jgi:hypothetical protein